MIRLYQFAPAMGLPNASPFCMKVETYLRMVGLPFETVDHGNPLKGPRGKLPYIDDGGTLVADSSFIVEHLKQAHGDPLDGVLTPVQQAQGLAFQRLMEEHLYWAVVYTRWADPAGWAMTRPAFFGHLVPPLAWIFPLLARRGLLSQLRGQGLGRLTHEEIMARGRTDISALSNFLADKPFVLGDAPSSYDATAHAFLANLLWAPLDTPLREHARRLPNLDRYCRRMKARYFG